VARPACDAKRRGGDNSLPMLHCNIAFAARYMRRRSESTVSKQLSLSAAISTFVMAAFVLLGAADMRHPGETGATTGIAAPAFEAALPTP
jgi:hypothetical protein